jgi:hypothetical protein
MLTSGSRKSKDGFSVLFFIVEGQGICQAKFLVFHLPMENVGTVLLESVECSICLKHPYIGEIKSDVDLLNLNDGDTHAISTAT